MENIKERIQLDPQYQWDIQSMFATEEAWNQVYEEVQKAIPALGAYQGKLTKDGKTLFAFLEELMAVERKLERLITFSHMNMDQDTTVAQAQALHAKGMNLYVQFEQMTAFAKPEITALSQEALDTMMKSEPELQAYHQNLDDLMRRTDHILSAEEEAVMAAFGEVVDNPAKTYRMFNNADLTFPTPVDSKGKTYELTQGSFVPLLEKNDRVLRENAFKNLYHTYKSFENTLTSTLFGQVKALQVNAELRGFPSARAAALFENNVPESVYDALIDGVHEHMDAMHRYIALRKKVLGFDKQHMYDIYMPIVKDADQEYIPYDEAVNMVLEAIKPLGKEYVAIATKGLREEGWVDVYENKGKRSGAYSSGCYDSKPFILLNYQGTLDNVFTLIHELGHSMHSYLTHASQPYQLGSYSIFLAEIASTCNELLLLDYLMKAAKEPVRKKQLVNHYLDSFRTTVYRQTMFAEFEHQINLQMQHNKPFTAEWLNQTYGDLNQAYYGDAIVSDQEIAYEWMRIPHFYYNYYVFQYATGFSAAVTFSQAILEEGEAAVERYLGFLKAGRSDYPIEVLKKAGVDMENPAVVGKALEKFEALVVEMENLMA